MLLAGGQGSRLGILTRTSPSRRSPTAENTASLIFRSPTAPPGHRRGGRADAVSPAGAERLYRLRALRGISTCPTAAFTMSCRRIRPARPANGKPGTANAIYQNIPFIAQWDPEYVLVLSGDHIYKMDYNAMLHEHIKNGADPTIAVREVPWRKRCASASSTRTRNNRITEFEEKPAQPKSNKALHGRLHLLLEQNARI